MDALILSCSTGGGHNAAGRAVKEELERRGHRVTMLDPYSLAGHHWDDRVGQGYIRLAQKAPHLFGQVYHLGDLYRQLPIHSPVYGVNLSMCRTMDNYLASHHYDLILMPHIYPGEILTCMKNKGMAVPKTVFIATDYVCIPFTEEIDCDYYITPARELNADFIRRGIPEERLVSAGIPVGRAFYEDISRSDAARELGLDEEKRYLLLSGGSIGAGEMEKTAKILVDYLNKNADYRLIVVCGNNRSLHERLLRQYGDDGRVLLLASTRQMGLYMRLCDAFLSKPGGLSSTEAAVMGVPLIHVAAIPGCEVKNLNFFASHGMAIPVGDDLDMLPAALEQLRDPALAAQMRENQRTCIPAYAARTICDLAERMIV